MKKINLILAVIFLTLKCSMNAQIPVLMGMTYSGGANNYGTMFKINGDSSGFQVVHDFQDSTGRNPAGSLYKANNNLLYGLTRVGGLNNHGVIFSFNPNTLVYTDLVDLNLNNGGGPYWNNNFMQASNGKLYCTITGGGDSTHGVIGCLDPTNNSYTIVNSFYTASAHSPSSPLIQLSNGMMYGLCEQGGVVHPGGIYSFDINGNIYSQIYNSTYSTGNAMRGYMVNYYDTILYGCANVGGLHTAGVLFSYNLLTNSYTDLFDFNAASNGNGSMSGLIKASNGIIYGTSCSGSSNGPNYWGTIFSFDPSINSFAVLHYFNDTAGRFSDGGLLQASDGKLYGMTQSGGANGSGVIFSYDITNNAYTVIHNFNGTDGNSPYGNLTEITETSTGVSGLSKENNVTVYPNPNNGTFTLQYNLSAAGSLRITDVLGREVYAYNLPNRSGQETVTLPLSHGIYFWQVLQEHSVSAKGKLVIIK